LVRWCSMCGSACWFVFLESEMSEEMSEEGS
jgi:hypothetical protein